MSSAQEISATTPASSSQNSYINQYLINVMKRNAPILIFEPEEKYFTDNVDAYLQVVDLCNLRDKSVIAKPPLTQANLPSGDPSRETFLAIPSGNEGIESGNPATTKVYVHALGWTHNGRSGYDFQYFFFYPYNGTGFLIIKLGALATGDIGIPGGNHEGDWESIIVRTDTEGNVIGIYCNQHSGGTWYLPDQLEWSSDRHPHIYVARYGHPCYASVGHFPTPKGDLTVSVGGLEFGVQLDNVTGKGRMLPTAPIAELVAASFVPGTDITPPWWLDYLGRYGLVTYNEQDLKRITGTLEDVLHKVAVPEPIAGEAAAQIANWLVDKLEEITPDGPEPPKTKGWWDTVQSDGPWRTLDYHWIGNTAISSLESHIDPRSDFGPSLAVSGETVHMVYKGYKTNALYAATYDGLQWLGNTPIKIAGGDPESNRTPGLAWFKDKLYMAYKRADSNALYIAWYDGTAWHGNEVIRVPGGLDPMSDDGPALAAFNGQLYMVHKAQGPFSNELYLSWYDGVRWHGNRPITIPQGNSPLSPGRPALVKYDDLLFMVFRAADASKSLYAAWFDGLQWHGNTTIQTPTGIPVSTHEPWAAVAGGELMVMFKSQSSDELWWVAYDQAFGWWGNSRITPISPQSDQSGAAVAYGHGLLTVYKAHNGTDFYQSMLMP